MTDITDRDRRNARQWASRIGKGTNVASDDTKAAARVILATVDAPAPTLADELRKLATVLPVEHQWLDEIDLLAAQMEQDAEDRQEWNLNITKQVATLARERDEARAEVERLTKALADAQAALPREEVIAHPITPTDAHTARQVAQQCCLNIWKIPLDTPIRTDRFRELRRLTVGTSADALATTIRVWDHLDQLTGEPAHTIEDIGHHEGEDA